MRRLKRFRGMAPSERRLLIRSLIWVSVIRVGLWVLPLRFVRAGILKCVNSSRDYPVNDVVRAVTRASRLVPGASCLTQALVAQALLAGSSHQSRIEIGVAKDGNVFAAHAWLVCDGQVILGGPDVTRYMPPLASWEAVEEYLHRARIL